MATTHLEALWTSLSVESLGGAFSSKTLEFTKVPDAWSVLIFDIVGSSKAIAAGAYKQVNMVGAMCIASAIRYFNRHDIPFVFGGDGATLLIPTTLISGYTQAVQSVMQRSRREFGLDIRAGFVEVTQLRKLGADVLLRRERVAKSFSRNDFLGGGLDLAEKLIKTCTIPSVKIDVPEAVDDSKLDLVGLECRWEPIRAKRGLFHSVIIKSRDPRPEMSQAVFRVILEVLGARQKIDPSQLRTSINPFRLCDEVRAHKSGAESFFGFWGKVMSLWIIGVWGRFAMAYGTIKEGVRWGDYRSATVRNTDAVKIDDALRFVVDLSFTESKNLESVLAKLEMERKIVFAIHKSVTAQLTCFVSSHADDHIHFIDGSDGGYASAALELKAKIANSESKSRSIDIVTGL